MKYKIIIDSECELTDKIEGCEYVSIINPHKRSEADAGSAKYLKLIMQGIQNYKGSFPFPEDFKREYECDAEVIFVVTISRKLCASFASATIGRSLYFDEHGEDKRIKVVNSNAVSRGEARIVEAIIDHIEEGCSYEDICEAVTALKKRLNKEFLAELCEYKKVAFQ